MSNQQVDVRPASPPLCAICKEIRSAETARLMPCGHEFDMACIRILLSTPILATRCPLCRVTLTEVRYDYTSWADYRAYDLAAGLPFTPISSGPLRQEAWAQQSQPVVELEPRPVAQHGTSNPNPNPRESSYTWLHAHKIEGDNYILVRRALRLTIQQDGAVTKSALNRKLTLKTIPRSVGDAMVTFHGPPQPAEIEKARRN